MKKYFILLIILIIAVSVISVSAKTIYGIFDSEGNMVGATDQGYLTYEQIEQGYTIKILFESKESTQQSQQKNSKSVPIKPPAKIEVDDWTNRPSESGDYVYIEGVLKNTGQGNADMVQVKARGLDKNGKLVAMERTYANPYYILAKGSDTFEIMMTYYEEVKTYALDLQWDNE